MKTLIVSYSFSGNNFKLAKALAAQKGAEFVSLSEKKRRTIMRILFDVLLKRAPEIENPGIDFSQYSRVIFVAPIWFGKVASPVRTIFKEFRSEIRSYSFISLSAGAHGGNPHIEKELTSLVGKYPVNVVNLLLSQDLFAAEKPSAKMLNDYRISYEEAEKMAMSLKIDF